VQGDGTETDDKENSKIDVRECVHYYICDD
jgi:hypothetical protein